MRQATVSDWERGVYAPRGAANRLLLMLAERSGVSYEVAEGQYIQVIDVEGRQCSDFLAFSAHKMWQFSTRRLSRPSNPDREIVTAFHGNPGRFAGGS